VALAAYLPWPVFCAWWMAVDRPGKRCIGLAGCWLSGVSGCVGGR
jgi:hypothetical protein